MIQFDRSSAGLGDAGHANEVIDLCTIGFDPVLRAHDEPNWIDDSAPDGVKRRPIAIATNLAGLRSLSAKNETAQIHHDRSGGHLRHEVSHWCKPNWQPADFDNGAMMRRDAAVTSRSIGVGSNLAAGMIVKTGVK